MENTTEDKELLLNQWQTCVDMANSVSQRRDNMNNIFITLKQPASCILILAGVYSTYSKWINIEIELAQSMGKKIIAIEPWGAERTSSKVKSAAHSIVRWNTDSIINAIRGY